MQIIIERFEGSQAIVELPDGTAARMDKILLAGFSEGDVVMVEKDREATEKARKRAEDAIADLF